MSLRLNCKRHRGMELCRQWADAHVGTGLLRGPAGKKNKYT